MTGICSWPVPASSHGRFRHLLTAGAVICSLYESFAHRTCRRVANDALSKLERQCCAVSSGRDGLGAQRRPSRSQSPAHSTRPSLAMAMAGQALDIPYGRLETPDGEVLFCLQCADASEPVRFTYLHGFYFEGAGLGRQRLRRDSRCSSRRAACVGLCPAHPQSLIERCPYRSQSPAL